MPWLPLPPARRPLPPPYLRGDLVRCEGCRLSFVAKARSTACPRCRGVEMRKLAAKPPGGGVAGEAARA